MRMEIVALDPPDFQKWLDNQLEPYTAPEEGTLAADRRGRPSSPSARGATRSTASPTSDGEPGRSSAPDQWVYSGAAPNLTNLMTRNTFAGASWDLLTEDCRDEVWNASPDEFGAALPRGRHPRSA